MAKKLLKLSTLLGVVLVIFLLAGCPLTQPKFTLNVSYEGQGDVNLAPAEGPFTKGTTVTLTAVPEEGWEFVEWSGDLSGSDNPESLVMDEEKSVTAHFEEKAPKPTITFVEYPEKGVCGGDRFTAKVQVENADDVTFYLERNGDVIEPEDEEEVNGLYTVTFESTETDSDVVYDLVVEASNEDEEAVDSKSIIIYKTDKTPPQTPTMSFIGGMPACDATSVVLQFGVCDETAIDVSSLRFEVSHGEFEVTVSPEVSKECLTNGEVEWEFGDVDCEELEITMFISDKCGNEASRTRTIDSIDNMKPEIEFVTTEGGCSEEVQYVEWKVTENCLIDFDATTCCEAVSVEFGEWVEDDSGDRIVTTIPATMTFNNIEDCTDFDFDVTAVDECGNEAEQDKFTVHKDLRDPRIRLYGFLTPELFSPSLDTVMGILTAAYDIVIGQDATPININNIPALSEVDGEIDEGDLLSPACDAKKAYFVWLAEDDCIDEEETTIEYSDNVCRTGEFVQDKRTGYVVGYQRVDFDCDVDCEEISGNLTVKDICGNDDTEEATIVMDNLPPRVDWDIEEPKCGESSATITWSVVDGAATVLTYFELSKGSLDFTPPSTATEGEAIWTFGEEADCEDLTATITVLDDCDDCWGRCFGDIVEPSPNYGEFSNQENGYPEPCGANMFIDSITLENVDNMEPIIGDNESELVGAGETDCGFTKAFFSFAATENCVEDFWVEYEIVGIDPDCEASETGEFRNLTPDATLLEETDRWYTTFEGTMTLPDYNNATIVATAFVKDGCHTTSIPLLGEGWEFDNVAPDVDYYTDPVNLDCVKQGDSIYLHAEAFDCCLSDYDITVTWDSTRNYVKDEDYTLDDGYVGTPSSTNVTYEATLTITATDIEETFTVTMVATDCCGNTTTESFDFRVDSIAPDLDDFAFNAKTNKLWFWLTEDIYPANDEVKLTIYVYPETGDPGNFDPDDPQADGWQRIVEGVTSADSEFEDTSEPMYYNKDLNDNWMRNELIANLDHEAFNYDLEKDVYYAFVLEYIEDECGNTNRVYGYDDAIHFSPEF